MNSYVGDVINKDTVKGTVQTIHEQDQQESGNRGAQRSLGGTHEPAIAVGCFFMKVC